MAFVFGLGPNAGLSLIVGGAILEDVTSTCYDWTLILLVDTGENDISMLSPFLSIFGPMLYLMTLCCEQFSGQKGFAISKHSAFWCLSE